GVPFASGHREGVAVEADNSGMNVRALLWVTLAVLSAASSSAAIAGMSVQDTTRAVPSSEVDRLERKSADPSVAQLPTCAGILFGLKAVFDSIFCGERGRISCFIYIDSTAQVAVRLPGVGWVDSTTAAHDTSIVFGRTNLFDAGGVLVSAQCP